MQLYCCRILLNVILLSWCCFECQCKLIDVGCYWSGLFKFPLIINQFAYIFVENASIMVLKITNKNSIGLTSMRDLLISLPQSGSGVLRRLQAQLVINLQVYQSYSFLPKCLISQCLNFIRQNITVHNISRCRSVPVQLYTCTIVLRWNAITLAIAQRESTLRVSKQ